MSSSQIDSIIENVNASMSMENMPLTENDKARIAKCLKGETTFNKAIEDLIALYKN